MSKFAAAFDALAKTLVVNLPAGVQPEDQLKSPIKMVLEAAAPQVEAFTEARIEIGRPDFAVRRRNAICGYVELKEPGKGANTNRLKGADKAQWQRFSALPNLIYTDGHDWTLYRSGKSVMAIRAVVDGEGKIDPAVIAKLEVLLTDFMQWQPIAPTTSKALAEMLAPLCRMLRDDVAEALHGEFSALRALSTEIREALFPNASHRDFADTYAQTLTYALLLARLLGEADLTAESAAKKLDSGHKLLAEVLRHMAHPAARAEVATAVDVLERVISVVDPARLARKGDPWIYFYEHFLEAYDPKLRRDRGVYYTPAEVVQAQVRLADELLRTRFGKHKGYADEGVVFLDPAAGTAAYPLAMIEHALAQVERDWGAGMVATAAGELARNVHAFEILVGPYAVAHLRISESIRAHGGTFPDSGLPVYLTDTLESPNAAAPSGGIFSKSMTDEHRRAIRIKRDVQVLVCMGNPPYDREHAEDAANPTPTAERKGGWVRFGDREAQKGRADKKAVKKGDEQSSDEVTELGILEDFLRPAREAGMGGHLKNIYNDYVYFWRWALWKLFENPHVHGPGIVSFITASSYLRGPGFVGMRQKMREAFDELWILDLGGDNLGARKTPNVFNIQTPVAIAIGVRYSVAQPQTPAVTHYTRLDADTRESKLARIGMLTTFADLDWQTCFSGWQKPLLPEGKGDYYGWPLLTDVFPWQGVGCKFERSWPIGETPELLTKRWEQLLGAPAASKPKLFREDDDRKVDKQYLQLGQRVIRSPAISSLPPDAEHIPLQRYSFRSFDRQWAIPDNRIGGRMNPGFWYTSSSEQVFLCSLLTGVMGLGPAAIAAPYVPDIHYFSGRGGKDVIPLWRDAEATQANVTAGLLDVLTAEYARPIIAEDLFAYAYAVLTTPSYVERFSEELTVPGPRLPLSRDPTLFAEAAALGRELICLHTYGERFVPPGGYFGQMPQGSARLVQPIADTPERYPETFNHDFVTQILHVGDGEISGVSREVFEFSVSGFEVVKSWLSYRMKEGAGRKSSELDKLRPERWTQQMSQELLQLLWMLEDTLSYYPQLTNLLERIVAAPLFQADQLPQPDEAQRKPPGRDEENEASLPVQPSLI
jgi:hypothetical protein